jgi:hypothetical protein
MTVVKPQKNGEIMKKVFLVILIAFSVLNAQFKEELNRSVDVKSGIFNKDGSGSSFPFGFLGLQNFSMKHSFDLSYSTFGNFGMALGMYTNTMSFNFSDKLDIQADVSLINSPYNTLGESFSKQINGIYLSRVEMNYKVSDNMHFMIQYNNSPFGYYSPFYQGGYSPFFRNSIFDRY